MWCDETLVELQQLAKPVAKEASAWASCSEVRCAELVIPQVTTFARSTPHRSRSSKRRTVS